MSLSSGVSRLTEYRRRHGLAATVRRAGIAAKRSIFAGRMVVFYCDLDVAKLRQVTIPKTLAVERVRSLTDLKEKHLHEITAIWNPRLASRNIRERFEKRASLWLVECEGQLAGYGWTLQGAAIEPYYFPLTPGDVQLFDFYVFPKFRGRALHWLLTGHILQTLAGEGASRAFADTGEWNEAQLASFKMTSLRRLGVVRTYKIFGRQLTAWDPADPEAQVEQHAARRNQAIKALRS